ncbi:MAG TPA: hypothetical protein VF475_03580 [Sphingobium sp.]
MDALKTFAGFAGLLAIVGAIFFIVAGMICVETHETRPWAGLQKRARTRKDGSTYVQTYYSKGPKVVKGKIPRWANVGTGICTLILLALLFVPA